MAVNHEVPAGFATVEVASRSHGELPSIIGIVTDFLPPIKSRGKDYQFTFTITDRPQCRDDWGLKVKFFRPSPAEFPPLQSNGDIVILRKIKINSWNGRTVAISNVATEWTVVPASSIPEKQPPGDFKLPHASSPGAERPSSAEYRYVIALRNVQSSNSPAGSTDSSRDYRHRTPLQSAACDSIPRRNYPMQDYPRGNGSHKPVDSIIGHAPIQKQNFPSVSVQYSSEYGSNAATPHATDHRSSHKLSPATKSVTDPTVIARNPNLPSISYGGGLKPKITLIKDIREYIFSDLVGQVVRIFHTGGEKLELYITDYTANTHLFNYEWGAGENRGMGADGDEFGYALSRRYDNSWPGPYGKMTLLVILWSPHSFYAQNHVQEGDHVFLRNVKIKYNNQGGTRLEGWLHTNRTNPDRIDISVIKNEKDECVQALLERKRAYWKKAKQQEAEYLVTTKNIKNGQSEEPKSVRKRQVEEIDSEPEAEEVLATRPGKKKKRRQRRKANTKQHQKVHAEQVTRDVLSRVNEVNPHVKSKHPVVEPISLSNLAKGIRLDLKSPQGVDYVLPFHNLCCRARVRVVDFFPPNLEDFAMPTDDPELDVLSDSGCSRSSRDSAEIPGPWQHVEKEVTERTWEWRFYLLVEDANTKSATTKNGDVCRLKLMVGHREAEFLLQLTPEDLRHNPARLAELREKLFVLWGDLEECKSTATARALQDVSTNANSKVSWYGSEKGTEKGQVNQGFGSHSGRPFDCCIKEYGVPVRRAEGDEDGDVKVERYERRFMMFGTTIM